MGFVRQLNKNNFMLLNIFFLCFLAVRCSILESSFIGIINFKKAIIDSMKAFITVNSEVRLTIQLDVSSFQKPKDLRVFT